MLNRNLFETMFGLWDLPIICSEGMLTSLRSLLQGMLIKPREFMGIVQTLISIVNNWEKVSGNCTSSVLRKSRLKSWRTKKKKMMMKT